tara:strand:- start:412 stop:1398 length:987 start_codon:yes stop_codon:yes gene_type:complete
MSKSQVICIGEALIDKIIDNSGSTHKDYLGGAPANVACALRKLNVQTAFIGCLGDDDYGQKFIKLFNKLKVNISFLQIDKKSSTRVVKVNRDQNGDRSFAGFENFKGDLFSDEVLIKIDLQNNIINLKKLLLDANYIVTGTNILISKESEETLFFIIECAKDYDIKIVIDINWRNIFWDNSFINKEDRLKKIFKLLDYADILKLASEEAHMFFETNDPLLISQMLFKKPDVIITDGPNPVHWFINSIKGENKVVVSQKIIDTTGAGDAFLAGLIYRFLTDKNQLDHKSITKIIEFASVNGYLTCLGEGAIKSQPKEKLVYEFLEKLGS